MTSDQEDSGRSTPTPNQVLPQDKGKGQSAPIRKKEEANDIQDGWVVLDERWHEEWEHGKWSQKLVDGEAWYSPEIWIPYAHEHSDGEETESSDTKEGSRSSEDKNEMPGTWISDNEEKKQNTSG
jgi:hypothetical protein